MQLIHSISVQAAIKFAHKQSFWWKLSMLVQAAGFKANLRAPFGHKLSFWWKQTYYNENKYVSMLLSQVKATFGDKQA